MLPTQLAFSVITDTYDKSILDLGQLFHKAQCSVHQFHIKAQGHGFNASGVLSGSWKEIALIEVLISEHAKKNQWDVKIWRPQNNEQQAGIPYVMEAIFIEDQSRTLSHLLELLSDLDIAIKNCDHQVSTLDNAHLLVRLRFELRLPFKMPIQGLRERFYQLCDHFNIDGSIELCQG